MTKNVSFIGVIIFFLMLLPACRQEGRTSTITPDGNLSEISLIEADYVEPGIKWGFISMEGDMVIKEQFDDCRDFSEGKSAASKKGLWGFIDKKGKWIVEPKYRGTWSFKSGLAKVKLLDGKYGYIDQSGYEVIQPIWENADDFHEGYTLVQSNGKYQFIDSTGHFLSEDSWEQAFHFQNGFAKISNGGWWGLLNKKGLIVVNPLYETLGEVQNNRIPFETKGHWGYLDTIGNIKIQAMYEEALAFQNNVAVVKNGNKWLWIDTIGKQINVNNVDIVYSLGSHHWAAIKNDTAFAMTSLTGDILTPFHFSQINKFSEGLSLFAKDGFWGYMDGNGKSVVSNIFLLAWDFKNGFARYSVGRGIGFINTQGKANNDLTFPDVRDFSEGLAKAQTVTRY